VGDPSDGDGAAEVAAGGAGEGVASGEPVAVAVGWLARDMLGRGLVSQATSVVAAAADQARKRRRLTLGIGSIPSR